MTQKTADKKEDNPAPEHMKLTEEEQKQQRSHKLCQQLLELHDLDYRKAMQAISSHELDASIQAVSSHDVRCAVT